MPIYMDRHDLNDAITAEHVANIHQEDLKIEHEFGCKGLTYWFDDHRKTAFCLIKAPNKEALKEMHNKAHGAIPNSIIEVDPNIVESFLGRIEDPVKAKNDTLNVIKDPAFRVLMFVDIPLIKLDAGNRESRRTKLRSFHRLLKAQVKSFNGRMVKDSMFSSLISFQSVSDAMSCSLGVQSEFRSLSKDAAAFRLKIGLSSGIPISEREGIFEDTIEMAERLSRVVNGEIVISSEVKELYQSENLNKSIDQNLVRYLNPSDEKFLKLFMDFLDASWNNPSLKVDDFCFTLGLSKSQLYRKIKSLTGVSLNLFLKDYRLQMALKLLDRQHGNISEIAFDTGFNSPAYFSKCFYEAYGVLPSHYVKDHD